MSDYKRLTKKDKYGHWYTDTKINDRFMWSEDGKVWKRDLSHYAFDGEAIDRLAELEDKIENGTLVETPCKVGDTVYFDTYRHGESIGVQPHKVERVEVVFRTERTFGNVGADIPEWQFGKSVFLTKSEAEARLKELKEEKE